MHQPRNIRASSPAASLVTTFGISLLLCLLAMATAEDASPKACTDIPKFLRRMRRNRRNWNNLTRNRGYRYRLVQFQVLVGLDGVGFEDATSWMTLPQTVQVMNYGQPNEVILPQPRPEGGPGYPTMADLFETIPSMVSNPTYVERGCEVTKCEANYNRRSGAPRKFRIRVECSQPEGLLIMETKAIIGRFLIF